MAKALTLVYSTFVVSFYGSSMCSSLLASQTSSNPIHNIINAPWEHGTLGTKNSGKIGL